MLTFARPGCGGSPRILHKCKFTVFLIQKLVIALLITIEPAALAQLAGNQSISLRQLLHVFICCCFCIFFIKVVYTVSTLMQMCLIVRMYVRVYLLH